MRGSWILSALTVLTLSQFAVSVVPGQCPSLQNVCYYSDVAKLRPAASAIQYFAVGGLFDIHEQGEDAFTCGTQLNPMGILHTHAFLWSLNYWQSSSSSVSIGGVVFDSCQRQSQLIQNLLGFEQCNIRVSDISRHNVVAFVGPTTNMETMAAAKLTGDMDLTLISPSAESSLLSNVQKYPYFLRTTPTIEEDINIMTFMLMNVTTTYVAVIYQESQMAAYKSFEDKMEENKICISGSYSFTGEESTSTLRAFVLNTLANLEPTRYIALFLSPELLESFLSQVTAADEVKSMNFVFLMTSDIRRNSPVFNGQNAVAASDAIVLERAEPVSVASAVDQFKMYWNPGTIRASLAAMGRVSDPFLLQYLNTTKSLPPFDVEAAFTIMATKAIVDGTRQAGQNSGCNLNSYLCSQFFDNPNRGSTIYQSIRSTTNFFTPKGAGGAYANGDLGSNVVSYNIYRYLSNGSFVQIGVYNMGAVTISTGIYGTRPYQPGGCQLQCCERPSTTVPSTLPLITTPAQCIPDTGNGTYSLVYYPPNQEITGAYMQTQKRSDSEYATRFEIGQKWIIAIGVLAGMGILGVLIFEIYILYKVLGTRMGNSWRTMWLGQLLLLGILLCYLTLFVYLMIPTDATCGITRFGVGFSYSVCFAVLLVKLMVILTSQTTDATLLPGDMESPNYLKGIYQFLMFVFVVGVQVVIDAQWLFHVPPQAIKVVANSGDMVWVCNHYTFRATGSKASMFDMSAFVRNEFENHLLSLIYIMFLILITTILALRAHGFITNHRESVFIGIAAGFSIPIWLAWALVGGLNRDHPDANEFGDACIAFGLFANATLLLFAMYLPKVRQLVSMGVEGIYYEDDHETVYGGSVIMAPSYKSRPNSVIYVNNQGMYAEPVVVNGDGGYVRQTSLDKPAPSTFSAPPTYLKRGNDSTIRGGSVLRVTDDLSGRRPLEKKRSTSEFAYGTTSSRHRSQRGTLPRSRSQTSLGAL